MADKNIFKIAMKLSGRMTQLPDSQKIFGALIYYYSEWASPQKAGELVRRIKTGEVWLSLSDMMPQDCFPVPQTFLLDKLANIKTNTQNQNSKKLIYNNIKKRLYLNKEQLKKISEKPQNAGEIYPYVKLDASQQIHAAIDSFNYNLPGLDPNLYSVPEATVVMVDRIAKKGDKESDKKSEKKDYVETKQQIKEFCFYLAVDQGDLGKELLKLFEAAQDGNHIFFLGPRASQGLNVYTITGIETEKISNQASQYYLNMGMLLPDRIDFKQSSLKLFTSERCPYNQLDGWNQNMEHQFISFIQAGSIIYPSAGIEQAGKSIESPYGKEAITFGNAFLYPLSDIF